MQSKSWDFLYRAPRAGAAGPRSPRPTLPVPPCRAVPGSPRCCASPGAIGRRVFLPAFVSPIVCTDCFEYQIKPLCSTIRICAVRGPGAGVPEPACPGPPVPLVPAVTCRAVAGPPVPSLRTSLRRAERRERPRSQHEHHQGLQHLGDRIPGGERRRGGLRAPAGQGGVSRGPSSPGRASLLSRGAAKPPLPHPKCPFPCSHCIIPFFPRIPSMLGVPPATQGRARWPGGVWPVAHKQWLLRGCCAVCGTQGCVSTLWAPVQPPITSLSHPASRSNPNRAK